MPVQGRMSVRRSSCGRRSCSLRAKKPNCSSKLQKRPLHPALSACLLYTKKCGLKAVFASWWCWSDAESPASLNTRSAAGATPVGNGISLGAELAYQTFHGGDGDRAVDAQQGSVCGPATDDPGTQRVTGEKAPQKAGAPSNPSLFDAVLS